MKNLLILGGVAAALYYIYTRTSAGAASTSPANTNTGASALNNPPATMRGVAPGNSISLAGSAFSVKVPGLRSVS